MPKGRLKARKRRLANQAREHNEEIESIRKAHASGILSPVNTARQDPPKLSPLPDVEELWRAVEAGMEDLEVWEQAYPSGLVVEMDNDCRLSFGTPFEPVASLSTVKLVIKDYLERHDFLWRGEYSLNDFPKKILGRDADIGDRASALNSPFLKDLFEKTYSPAYIWPEDEIKVLNTWCSYVCTFGANMMLFHKLRAFGEQGWSASLNKYPMEQFDIDFGDVLWDMSGYPYPNTSGKSPGQDFPEDDERLNIDL